MIDRTGGRPERRRHLRFAVKGTVILAAGTLSRTGRIANLSQGGLLLTVLDGPPPDPDTAIELVVRLDGPDAAWVRASGRIVRRTETDVALVFDPVPAELAGLIDRMETASGAHRRILSVVLVDASPGRRAAIAEGFRAAGCRVVEACTPLEAIVRLGESSFEPELIAIADSVPSAIADDLRHFVARNHPGAQLVTVGDEAIPADPARDWLSSADPGADLSTRVRNLLGRPRRPTGGGG